MNRLAILSLAVLGTALLLFIAWSLLRDDGEEPSGSRTPIVAPVTESGDPDEEAAVELRPSPPLDDEPATSSRSFSGRPHGRILDLETENPVPEAKVQLMSRGHRTVVWTVDDEGGFGGDYTGGEEITATAIPPEGWVAVTKLFPLDAEQRSGQSPIELRLRPGRSAPISGRVIDARTGDPIFDVRVELRHVDEGGEETMTTDLAGAFLTGGAYPPGDLEAIVSDRPDHDYVAIGSFRRRHLDEENPSTTWEMLVRIGPTVYVRPNPADRIEPGRGWGQIVERPLATDYAAVLACDAEGLQLTGRGAPTGNAQRTHDEMIAALRALGYLDEEDVLPVLAGTSAEPRWWPRVRLRSGNPRWIRYAKQVHPPNARLQPRVRVEGPGGWSGEATLQQTVGKHPGTVLVPLDLTCWVSGHVVDEKGEGIDGARVVLESDREDDVPPVPACTTASDGSFRFDDLEEARYRIGLGVFGREGNWLSFPARPGGYDLGPLRLEAWGEGGPVSGELLFDARIVDRLPLVLLDGPGGTYAAHARRGAVAGTATFTFPSLPEGSYRLALVGQSRGDVSWKHRGYVHPPASKVTITAEVDGRARPHRFSITERTGFAVPGWKVVFGPYGWLQGEEIGSRLRGPIPVARDEPLQWMVTAPGYRPAFGTESDFNRADDGFLLERTLELGWGTRLYLRQLIPRLDDESTPDQGTNSEKTTALFFASPPLAGVQVFADDRLVGQTDLSGRIDLAFPATPHEIGIRAPGWHAVTLTPLGCGRVSRAHIAVLWLEAD